DHVLDRKLSLFRLFARRLPFCSVAATLAGDGTGFLGLAIVCGERLIDLYAKPAALRPDSDHPLRTIRRRARRNGLLLAAVPPRRPAPSDLKLGHLELGRGAPDRGPHFHHDLAGWH